MTHAYSVGFLFGKLYILQLTIFQTTLDYLDEEELFSSPKQEFFSFCLISNMFEIFKSDPVHYLCLSVQLATALNVTKMLGKHSCLKYLG